MSDLEQGLLDVLSPWQDVPGVAVCVVVRGQDPVIACTGYASLEHQLPVNGKTRFNIASVSKQFTGFAARLLEKRGLLTLDDPLLEYLPDLPPAYGEIRIHHLLHHTSGFRDMYNLQAYGGFRRDDVHTQEQLFALVGREGRLNFKPGDRFNYNNTGFIMMAEIVRLLTGMDLRRFLDAELFKPLGMNDTVVCSDHKEMVPNYAGHYNRLEDGSYAKAAENVSVSGSTNIVTSIEDFARWLGNFTAPKVQAEVMMGLNLTHPLNDGSMNPYGCGLELSERGGRALWTHGGGAGGFRSQMMFVPDDCVAVGVLSNNGSMDAATLGNRVLELALPGMGIQGHATAGTTSVAFSEHEGKDLPGHYRMAGGLLATVEAVDGQLLIHTPFYPTRLPMVKTGEHHYRIELLNADLTPECDEHGRVVAFNSTSPVGPLHADKLPPIALDKHALAEYAGKYFNAELLNLWTVVFANGGLALVHPHFPEIRLFAVLEDEFSSETENFDRVSFIRNGQGQVIALEFSGDRAFNVRFERVEQLTYRN